MSLGKASIKRASAAGRKKTVEATEAVIENVVEKVEEMEVKEAVKESVKSTPKTPEKKAVKKTAVKNKVEKEEIQVKFVPEEERKNRPVRLTEEMPTFLL